MNQLDMHTHSIASGHGTICTITDMSKQAYKKGLSLLGITDHGPATLCSCKPSYFRSLMLAPKTRYGVNLLYGVELNILDYKGTVDLDFDTLSTLDYAIASIHSKNLAPGSRAENTEAYIGAIQNPHVKMLGHCDDVKYPVDYLAIVQAAKEHHVLLEINNASLAPNGYRGDTRENNITMLSYCRQYNLPIVLSSDSHGAAHIGDIKYAETLVRECDYPTNLILNYNYNKFLEFIR